MEEELELSYLDGEDVVDDVVGVDFNIVTHLHRQLQVNHSITTTKYVLNKDCRKEQLMSYLVHTNRCRDIIRMGPKAFINLCQRLRSTGLVKYAIRSTVEEQVAKFLHIIGYNMKNKSVAFFFHRSGSTVSKH